MGLEKQFPLFVDCALQNLKQHVGHPPSQGLTNVVMCLVIILTYLKKSILNKCLIKMSLIFYILNYSTTIATTQKACLDVGWQNNFYRDIP